MNDHVHGSGVRLGLRLGLGVGRRVVRVVGCKWMFDCVATVQHSQPAAGLGPFWASNTVLSHGQPLLAQQGTK